MSVSNFKRPGGFTLVEIIVSMTIFSLVVAIAMGCFLAILKQNKLIETTTDLSLSIQRAMRRIYYVVEASPTSQITLTSQDSHTNPQVFTDSGATALASLNNGAYSGLSIRVTPPTKYYAMVNGGTDKIGPFLNTFGYKNTATSIGISSTPPQATTYEILLPNVTCPSAKVTTLDTSIFVTSRNASDPAQTIDATTLFSSVTPNNTVFIPSTGYGGAVQLTVSSVSANSLTFSSQLNPSSSTWGLPNGTMIASSAAIRARFAVMAAASGSLQPGDLVYYPNDSITTQYSVLAHNIVYANNSSRVDPSDATAGTDPYPFTYNPTTRELIVNLQCLPPGNSVAGRATIGTRSRIYIRTDPNQGNL